MNTIKVLRPPFFPDHRGSFLKLWTLPSGEQQTRWPEIDVSVSHRNVLRGIHGDFNTEKLVTCVYGSVYCVVLDPKTGDWSSYQMGTDNMIQLVVPKGFGIGILVLSDIAVWHYLRSTIYAGQTSEFVIRYDDPFYGIYWPVSNPILSERDANA